MDSSIFRHQLRFNTSLPRQSTIRTSNQFATGWHNLNKNDIFSFLIVLLWLLWLPFSLISCDTQSNKQGSDVQTGVDSHVEKADQTTLNIVTFSTDPPACDPLHAFDPDSYEVISQIFDPLVYFDYDGEIQPGLATEWVRISPTVIQFTLREGVTFHNGEPFNAESVKGTFAIHADPATKSPTQNVLNTIKEVEILDEYKVNIHTHFPDGMLFYRMHMFGSIIPPNYVKEKGLDYFYNHPIGTGPFKFSEWNKGTSLTLVKNDTYWKPDIPKLEKVVFNMIPENLWLERLIDGSIDFCMYLSGKDAELIEKNTSTKIMKRLVLSSYWALFRNQGPLANEQVRHAMNIAIDREALIKYAEYGNGEIMASIGKQGEFGYNPNIEPYEYNIEKAKQLLVEAGYADGFTITALVSDISERVARNLKTQLQKIGINLELEIVSRPEWAKRIVIAKMTTGTVDFDGDMTINLVDNPIYNLAFHAFIFLHSTGAFSITADPELDQKIEWAVGVANKTRHEQRLQELDQYIHDHAFILTTYQRIITPGMQKNVQMRKINLNAHLDYNMLQDAYKEER